MRAAGVRLLVLLVEDNELRRWGEPRIADLARDAGLELVRFPLRDGTAPKTRTEMDDIQDAIHRSRSEGDVVVACMGGVGRSGTVAACALVRAGLAADAAISRVRELRHPTAVETRAQEAFVRDYGRG